MLQTYQGYFQGGRFVSAEAVSIPDNTKVLITVVDNEVPAVETAVSSLQLKALEQFITAVREIDNEPLSDEDFAALENNRVNFTREINL